MNRRAVYLPKFNIWLDPNSKAYELYQAIQAGKSKDYLKQSKAFESHVRLLK